MVENRHVVGGAAVKAARLLVDVLSDVQESKNLTFTFAEDDVIHCLYLYPR